MVLDTDVGLAFLTKESKGGFIFLMMNLSNKVASSISLGQTKEVPSKLGGILNGPLEIVGVKAPVYLYVL